jgi:hypothetical protein
VRCIACEVAFQTRCHLAYPNIWKKKVMGGCALPGADIQKPYAPKCGKRKTKIDLFRDFLQKSPSYEFYSNLSFHTVF